jgi:hypothetical protein
MEPEPPPVPPERATLYPEQPFGPRGFEPPRVAEGGLRFGPQAEGGLRIGPQTEAPMLAGTMAPMLPLPVPPERANRRSIYFLGFLSGLGLSLMTGIVLYFVLYFVINTTG